MSKSSIKTKILIVYQEMVLGGSTSNLLSLLSELDYSKVDVDLLLRRKEGALLGMIPSEVNVIEPIFNSSIISNKLKLLFKPRLLKEKYIAKCVGKILGYWTEIKYLENQDLEYTKDTKGEYDVAIGYLEGWTHTYIINHVNAKKKIGYLHLDYKSAGLIAPYDYNTFKELDKVLFVSQQNKVSFDEAFPDFTDKSSIMPHIFSQDYIRKTATTEKSGLELSNDCINFVTVARIAIEHKGFDRVLRVLRDHVNEEGFEKFRWYLIGEGPDFGIMQHLIKEYGLEDKVFMLGAKDNAYAYELGMDMFLQPSYYEGKPAAVYEAMILGVPPFVTEYASAHEQIEDGLEGMIVDNSENGIYEGLKHILNNPDDIIKMKEYMKTKDYDNMDDINYFYNLIGLN